jgi:hypothetical protein
MCYFDIINSFLKVALVIQYSCPTNEKRRGNKFQAVEEHPRSLVEFLLCHVS